MAEKSQKLKWNQHPIDDDIKYRGPLNYRHFKIIGWTLFVIRLVIPLIVLGGNADPALASAMFIPLSLMEILAPLSVFFLLIASFSQLLVDGNYKKELISNGGAALAIIIVFELLYHRYLVGAIDIFVGDHLESLALCNLIFSTVNPVGFAAFNVFLDLFLCTCVLFFLNYEPKKFFVGNKRIWFRCFALLPVIYEFVCLWLKIQANAGDYHMSISLFPFLTAKPPMMFFVFCAMVIYQMLHEKRFCKDGRTHEEYVQYLGTNRNSWQFARFAAILCLVAGAIDLIIAMAATLNELSMNATAYAAMADADKSILIEQLVNKYGNAGFGGAADLLIFAPIMLLFNYTKVYKKTTCELAIPVVSVVVLLVIYMEAGLVGLGMVAEILNNELGPQIEELAAFLDEYDPNEVNAEGEDIDLSALLAALQAEDSSSSAESPEKSSA